MDKRLKKGLIIGALIVLVLAIGVLVANSVVENKLKKALDNITETIKIRYQDIHVNSLTGSVNIMQPKISVYGKTTHTIIAQLELNEIVVKNLRY